jgi:hypothetical protein
MLTLFTITIMSVITQQERFEANASKASKDGFT